MGALMMSIFFLLHTYLVRSFSNTTAGLSCLGDMVEISITILLVFLTILKMYAKHHVQYRIDSNKLQ